MSGSRSSRQQVNYAELITLLQSRPGDWAKVGEFSYIPYLPLTLKSHGCEVVTRDAISSGGLFGVWARWPSTGHERTTGPHKLRDSGTSVPIDWQDPPAPAQRGKRGTINYETTVATTWSRPGEWLHVGVYPASKRVPISTSLRKRGCEVATRKVKQPQSTQGATQEPAQEIASSQRMTDIWARWPAIAPVGGAPVLDVDATWSDPGVAQVGLPRKLDYERVVALVRSRPGNWAKVGDFDKGRSEGPQSSLRKRGCEVAVRAVPDGQRSASRVSLWVRWNGERSEAIPFEGDAPDGFDWGEPSEVKAGRKPQYDYDAFTEYTKERAGDWVLLGEFPRKDFGAMYHALRRRGIKSRKERSDVGDDTVRVTAKFLIP